MIKLYLNFFLDRVALPTKPQIYHLKKIKTEITFKFGFKRNKKYLCEFSRRTRKKINFQSTIMREKKIVKPY